MKHVLSTFLAALLLVASQAGAVAQQTKAAEKKASAAAAGTTAAKGAAKEVPMSERCIGKTQDEHQCKRRAADGKKYCWQHDPNRKSKAGKKP